MNPLRRTDALLNSITMYRLLVYVLSLLLAIAFVSMLVDPSAYPARAWLGLIVTGGTLAITGFLANMSFAKLFKITPNHESGIITTLILTCILPQTMSFGRIPLLMLAAVLAVSIKYVLVWRGSHFLNPAATAAVIVSVTGLLPVTWWIGNPTMFVPMALLGAVVLRKIRRFELFGWFAVATIGLMILVSAPHGTGPLAAVHTLLFSYPFIFLGCIMLTEPTTMPSGRTNIALYGLLVGALFGSQLDLGVLSFSPHVALVIGNVFSAVISPKRGARLRLKQRLEIGPHIYDLTFSLPSAVELSFQAGQYMEWTIPGVAFDSRGNRRTFSIASSPTESELHIGIKTYEPSSAFKRRLLTLQPGDEILAGHIGGNFTLSANSSQKLLMIAGGIGVTPYRSMIKQLIDAKQTRDIVLVYSARPDEFVYKDIFEAAMKHGVKTVYFTDRLDAKQLAKLVPDFATRAAYISGPPGLVQGLKKALTMAGVSTARIHTDLFTGY